MTKDNTRSLEFENADDAVRYLLDKIKDRICERHQTKEPCVYCEDET